MVNKKVKNATSCSYDGYDFKSKFELKTYKRLKEAGYNPVYEGLRLTLIKGSKTSGLAYTTSKKHGLHPCKSVREMTYTPDFTFDVRDKKILIECKGFKTHEYELKRKLLFTQSYMETMIFFEIVTNKDLEEMINKLSEL